MSSNKNLGLEGLRGLASLTVAIGHFIFAFSSYLGGFFSPQPTAQIPHGFERWLQYPPLSLIYSAEAAVCVFFVMSGYVLTTKYFASGDVEDIQAAAAKRYVRLVLPSFASVMVAYFLLRSGAIIARESAPLGVSGWIPGLYSVNYDFLGSLFNGLIGAPLFAHTTLNPALWTIQVELIGSVLLFAMLAGFGRHHFWLCFWFVFFAVVLGYQQPNMLYYMAFFTGAMLNPARSWLISRPALCVSFSLLGLVGLAFNYSPFFSAMQAIRLPNLLPYLPDFNASPRLFWNTLGAVLLVAGVIGSDRISRLFSGRIPVFLGKVSFSIYLLHMSILTSVGLQTIRLLEAQGVRHSLAVALAFIIYMTVTMLLGVLFQRYVDQPSITLASYVAQKLSFKPKPTLSYDVVL